MATRRNISLRQLSFPFHPGKPDIEKRLSARLGTNVQIVYTDNTHTMISSRRGANGVMVLRLHHMFRDANNKIVGALFRYLRHRDRESSELLGEFIKENNGIIRHNPGRLKPAIETSGRFHDLAKYYMSLNERFFGGKLETAITWGNRTRHRGHNHIRLGSYSFENRLIRVHPALDRKWVPRYYVESVIYHEMLHADFGVRNKNGRCLFHTGEFREREEAFTHFRRAREWEKKYIKRLL